MYKAVTVAQAREVLVRFQQEWKDYPGTVAVWTNNFAHVEQLYNYGSAVRKVMYTTNAIESVNSSFRKVTQKGAFYDADAVFKILYLRVQELYKKWHNHAIQNWALIRNHLLIDEHMGELMQQYDKRC